MGWCEAGEGLQQSGAGDGTTACGQCGICMLVSCLSVLHAALPPSTIFSTQADLHWLAAHHLLPTDACQGAALLTFSKVLDQPGILLGILAPGQVAAAQEHRRWMGAGQRVRRNHKKNRQTKRRPRGALGVTLHRQAGPCTAAGNSNGESSHVGGTAGGKTGHGTAQRGRGRGTCSGRQCGRQGGPKSSNQTPACNRSH